VATKAGNKGETREEGKGKDENVDGGYKDKNNGG
jgi:hypothetical protein